MARILIAEPHQSGHHATYCYWLAREAIAIGHDVTIVTLPKSINNSYYSKLLNSASATFRVEPFLGRTLRGHTGNSNLQLLLKEWGYWRWFKCAYDAMARNGKIDFVVVPYLDYFLLVAGCVGSPFGRTSWAGITMRVGFHRKAIGIGKNPSGSWVRQKLFLRLLKNNSLKRIFTIDEAFDDYVRQERQFHKIRPKIGYLSDPAEISTLPSLRDSRERLGIEPDAFLLLVYGSVTLRKGISQLIASLDTDLRENGRNVCVVVAGRCDDQVRELFERGSGRTLVEQKRIVVIDRFVEPELEVALFGAANVIWLGYISHFGMSGVLVRAGQAGLPVIGPEEGLLSYIILKNRLGLCVDVGNIDSIRKSLRRMMADPTFAAECGKRGLEKFRSHTPGAFAQLILAEQVGCYQRLN